jgi:hypothetical protein
VVKLIELEGIFNDGFDNNLKYLFNRQNWQGPNLTNGKPQIALTRIVNDYAFELHVFPIIDGEPQPVVKPFHPKSPFKQYNPSILGPVVNIPGVRDLITMAVRCGDQADLELLKYAHILIEQLTNILADNFVMQGQTGQSIKDTFVLAEQQSQTRQPGQ